MNRPIPEVHVLWHPDCPLGEGLARRVHAWLRPGNGLGPQVFYRCLPAPDSPPGGLPPPLPGETRPGTPVAAPASHAAERLLVVVPLIDEHMIADPVWRYWLARLASPSGLAGPHVFLPVALDSTAYNVPPPLNELNFLRPGGLPLTGTGLPGAADPVEIVTRSLLKQLTESLCRILLGPPQAPAAAAIDTAAPKITVFLSHAKADGTTPARRIRDYIYSQTQLAAFYDENDIPFGSAFSRVLESNVSGNQTAALIAVRSARYATRPWCRRELSLFRRPRQDAATGRVAEHWRLHPTLMVDALEGGEPTVGIPELGNAPVIRWADDAASPAEQVVTATLRDVLLAAHHAALGRTMPDGPDRIVLNWLPDPTTLLHIPRVRAADSELTVFYPGRGLSGLELDILDELFPRVELRSFDQAMP